MSAERRTCYSCQHMPICAARRDLWDFITKRNLDYFDVNAASTEAGGWMSLFYALGTACQRFSQREGNET